MVKKTKKQNGGANGPKVRVNLGGEPLKGRKGVNLGGLPPNYSGSFGRKTKAQPLRFLELSPNPKKLSKFYKNTNLKKTTTTPAATAPAPEELETVPKIISTEQLLAPKLPETTTASQIAKTIVSKELESKHPEDAGYMSVENMTKKAKDAGYMSVENMPEKAEDAGYMSVENMIKPETYSGYMTVGANEKLNVPKSTQNTNQYLKNLPTNYKNNNKQAVYEILTEKARRANNFSARITRINPVALSKFQNDNARLSYFKSNFSPEMATKINEFFSKELQNKTNQTEKQTIIQEILNDFKLKALTNNNTRQTIYNNTKKFLNTKRNQNTKTGKTARSQLITNEIKKIRNASYSTLNPAQRSTTSSTSPISTEYSVLTRETVNA